jgi:hydrogenase large subunit
MATIKIDPVTRLEGHLSVTVNVEGGTVSEANVSGTMFRGFEKILVGRDPRDCPTLTQRICGVCHTVHRLTSLRAIEDAANVEIPYGAKLVRNLIQGVTHLYSHAAHLIVLQGPDFQNEVPELTFPTGEAYVDAIKMQRRLHEILAIFGGKVPHHMTSVPGGVSIVPTVDHAGRALMRALEVSDWLGPTENVPAVLDNILAGKPDMSLGKGLNYVVKLLAAAVGAGAADWGKGPGKFMAYGVFDMPDGSLLEPSGFFNGSSVEALDEKQITEDVTNSWLIDSSGGGYIADGAPTDMQYPKGNAYSYVKAIRYQGQAAETGPLARLVVAGLDPFDLRKNLAGGANASNTLARLIARAQETVFIRDKVLGVGLFEGKGWVDELLAVLKSGGASFSTPYKVPNSGIGVGLWEAPRGATGHWINIANKKVDRYQVNAGSTWNMNPRDATGQPGPLEQALAGVPVPDEANPINVLRTIHSFDPCLACSVHVISNSGKKYTMQVTPGE